MRCTIEPQANDEINWIFFYFTGLSTVNDLLSKPTLRYSAWGMATITCIGNSLVLWGRFTQRDENRAVSMVIRNLAVSDMLMGLYLSIIGIQDYRFRQQYGKVAYEWAASWTCIGVGVLAMVSSEVSLLILTFISIERFLLIADPFGGHRRLTTQNVLLCLFTIWLIGITIAIVPGTWGTIKNHLHIRIIIIIILSNEQQLSIGERVHISMAHTRAHVSHCTCKNVFHSVGSIRLSYSWASICFSCC